MATKIKRERRPLNLHVIHPPIWEKQGDLAFYALRDLFIAQNRTLLIQLARHFQLDEDTILKTYLTPTHYLPYIDHEYHRRHSS